MLEDKKRRWDQRQANGQENTWVLFSALSGTVIGLALIWWG